MSFSIDDLVSSLSSTHVGQEAIDLAVLQAQLAESLSSSSTSTFMHTSRQPPARGRAQHTQPCNTPLARTPSSSVSWMMDASADRPRSNSVSYNYNDMDEDERMVEELLIPSSSANANNSAATTSYHGYNYNYNYSQAPLSSPISPHSPFSPSSFSPSSHSSSSSHPSSSSAYTETTTSLFTSTDPFYLSQLQSLNDPSPSPSSQSVFAQNGRLAQNSPFALAAHAHAQYGYQHQHQHQHQQIPLSSYTAAF